MQFPSSFDEYGEYTVAHAKHGIDALWLSELAEKIWNERQKPIIFIAENQQRYDQIIQSLDFFNHDITKIIFPEWDCLPYDRNSPQRSIQSCRMYALYLIQHVNRPTIIVTTLRGFVQKIPQQDYHILSLSIGSTIAFDSIIEFLNHHGYLRCDNVLNVGEYAIRGGIIDIFTAQYDYPLRLDFFGDELDDIRFFDINSQQTLKDNDIIDQLLIAPAQELYLNDNTITQFRHEYRLLFGANAEKDTLYHAICNQIHYQGAEHWLSLFYDMHSLLDIINMPALVFDFSSEQNFLSYTNMITDHYDARCEAINEDIDNDNHDVYRPLQPDMLYWSSDDWEQMKNDYLNFHFSLFHADTDKYITLNSKPCEDFSNARRSNNVSLFDALTERVKNDKKKKHVIACQSDGTTIRLQKTLHEHESLTPIICHNWQELKNNTTHYKQHTIYLITLPLKTGFIFDDIILYSDSDLLGEGVNRPVSRRRKTGQYILNAQELNIGDIIVHNDHGIGRYDGLEIIEISNVPHECLKLIYYGDDHLFVPVENIEMISRYGQETDYKTITLDRLGMAIWQERKAKIKDKIQEIAEDLMRTAAKRSLQKAVIMQTDMPLYHEFCAGFGFVETDDQLFAIDDIIADLSSGQPMDRLICGDVGFGKTEVAMRAAFIAAYQGGQVAVIVPTTLLARQHYDRFCERFKDFPIKLGLLSRLVTAKQAKQNRQDLANGKLDIIIGTHALLSQQTTFYNLSLVIIDEEQHFGVKQKEKLKELRQNIHVLAMSATPIPRTMHMALSGVRQLSIIATPPVDRMPVKTSVMAFDSLVLREAIKREVFRGGRVYYVCPHIADLAHVEQQIKNMIPEIRMAKAHGSLSGDALEKVMSGFETGHYELLLSTNIIESGLDIGHANTIIIHRADMFGLSRLYQLRGRVGRGKQRGYCYLLYPKNRFISSQATRRLEVIQNLDGLGNGFTLASHDMDIRGAGNLVGAEQSGHIKEIGIELYQKMLEEAINTLKESQEDYNTNDTYQTNNKYVTYHDWAPQLNLGVAVMIPESFIDSLNIRMDLYRRLSQYDKEEDINNFSVEIHDRFGNIPQEMENLLKIMKIKIDCRIANIDKIDVGAKGVLVSFRDNKFANPSGLLQLLNKQGDKMKLRHDHKIFFPRIWKTSENRIKGTRDIAKALSHLAQKYN